MAIRNDFLENKIIVKIFSLFAFPSMFRREFLQLSNVCGFQQGIHGRLTPNSFGMFDFCK